MTKYYVTELRNCGNRESHKIWKDNYAVRGHQETGQSARKFPFLDYLYLKFHWILRNHSSITRIHLSLPVNTIQTSRDYWGKN